MRPDTKAGVQCMAVDHHPRQQTTAAPAVWLCEDEAERMSPLPALYAVKRDNQEVINKVETMTVL